MYSVTASERTTLFAGVFLVDEPGRFEHLGRDRRRAPAALRRADVSNHAPPQP